MKRAPFIISVAAVLLGYVAGCGAVPQEQSENKPRVEQVAKQAQAQSSLVIDKVDRHDQDDEFYGKGTMQYRVTCDGQTIDTHIPDLAKRSRGPPLDYFIILDTDETALAFAEESVKYAHLEERILNHPEYGRFIHYLLDDMNRPVKAMKGMKPRVEMESFHPDSMRSETYLKEFFSQDEVKLEREDIERVIPKIGYQTTFGGTLEEVLAQANKYHNAQYKAWRVAARNDNGNADRANDKEGFYMQVQRQPNGSYSLDVYSITLTGMTPDGRMIEF